MNTIIRSVDGGCGQLCREVLGQLPDWFGIEESNVGYFRFADENFCVVAEVDGSDVGFLAVKFHSAHSAEVEVMGVVPELHRCGVGRAMLQHLESDLERRGIEYLQVKTLSQSHPDEDYARTRAFYLEYGFRVLEEFPDLWDPANPSVMLIKTVVNRSGW
ncbi:MAG: GNAT family N-acetyltransferase [Actinomycetia bacterium]|nr:GNAT family N-acetyltransferase [Actinomycetes bacterium]